MQNQLTSLKLANTDFVEMSADKNTVIEDFLDEDTEIPGQRYVLLSFLSPEKVLDKKELFFFQKFLHAYEVDWKIKNLEKYLVDTVQGINDQLDERIKELEKSDQMASAEICRKNRLRIDNVMAEYGSFVQKSKADLNKTKIVEAYDDFLYAHKAKLEEEFYKINDCRNTIRGVKIRGVFSNTKEAELKAKRLQTKDKYHDILLGEVGKWTPWDPMSYEVKDQEFNNDQLNTLMKKYKENEDNREQFFEERTKGAKKVAGASIAEASNQFSSMFGTQGDLAHQRKVEKASITIERVSEEAELENKIVNPSS
jgi:cation transport regulator ChaB